MASTIWQSPPNSPTSDDKIQRLIQQADRLLENARLLGRTRRGYRLLKEAADTLQQIRQLQRKQTRLLTVDEYIKRLG
jgi:hypothetical protein